MKTLERKVTSLQSDIQSKGIPFSHLLYNYQASLGMADWTDAKTFDWLSHVNYVHLTRVSLYVYMTNNVGAPTNYTGRMSFMLGFHNVLTSPVLITTAFTTFNCTCSCGYEHPLIVPLDLLIKTDPADQVNVMFFNDVAAAAGTFRYYFNMEGEYFYNH